MLGDAGPTAIEVRVGLTKNPLQLTASASVASAANAPTRRILCCLDDMIVETPWARMVSFKTFLRLVLQKL
jgi:hypothetical protein